MAFSGNQESTTIPLAYMLINELTVKYYTDTDIFRHFIYHIESVALVHCCANQLRIESNHLSPRNHDLTSGVDTESSTLFISLKSLIVCSLVVVS